MCVECTREISVTSDVVNWLNKAMSNIQSLMLQKLD